MKISKKGLELIKVFEGFKSHPYLCSAGVPTIGYGSTYYENGNRVTLKDPPITEQQASDLLLFCLKRYERAVSNGVKVAIFQYEFDALVSLCYNIGVPAFNKSTLLKLLNHNELPVVVANQFLRWNKVDGQVSNGLTRRRRQERQLFLNMI